jgi:hypothetical protein
MNRIDEPAKPYQPVEKLSRHPLWAAQTAFHVTHEG